MISLTIITKHTALNLLIFKYVLVVKLTYGTICLYFFSDVIRILALQYISIDQCFIRNCCFILFLM